MGKSTSGDRNPEMKKTAKISEYLLRNLTISPEIWSQITGVKMTLERWQDHCFIFTEIGRSIGKTC